MTLYFISLGLIDERDMSLKALEMAKKCDLLFAEFYTQKMVTNKKKLERLIGKKIDVLTRSQVEEQPEIMLEPAKRKEVGLLVGGDVFSATTHTALRKEAFDRGIKTEVIHGSSIFSAVCETGLHIYKFGAVATIPLPERVRLPLSVYSTIKNNKDLNMHTLLLLDIDVESNRFLTVDEGIKILLELEKNEKKNVITEDSEMIVFVKAGNRNSKIFYGKLKDILNKQITETPAVIVIPGKLHFTEKEYLEMFRL